MNADFKEFESHHSGDSDNSQGKLDKETADTLISLDKSFAEKRASVVDTLLERVVLVSPAVHRNYKPGQ